MTRYNVTVEYWSTDKHESSVTVEAANEEEAKAKALEAADHGEADWEFVDCCSSDPHEVTSIREVSEEEAIACDEAIRRAAATTRLFAAAPDLLDALRRLMGDVMGTVGDPKAYGYAVSEEQHPLHTSIAAANAAIAKAEGAA